jgi:hypothetical protein
MIKYDKFRAYEVSYPVDDARKSTDDLDYREKAVDQLAIFVPITFTFECCFSV